VLASYLKEIETFLTATIREISWQNGLQSLKTTLKVKIQSQLQSLVDGMKAFILSRCDIDVDSRSNRRLFVEADLVLKSGIAHIMGTTCLSTTSLFQLFAQLDH
jgi:hypothetical protein